MDKKEFKDYKTVTPEAKKEIRDVLSCILDKRPISYNLRFFRFKRESGRLNVVFLQKDSYSGYKTFIKETAESIQVNLHTNCLPKGVKAVVEEFLFDYPDVEYFPSYNYGDDIDTVNIPTYAVILPKLKDILMRHNSNFGKFNRSGYKGYRRFGYKDEQVFFYRGERKTVMRIGKAIRKLGKMFDIEIDDNSLKEITNYIKTSESSYGLKIVEGDDIAKYYHYSNYSQYLNTGSLGNSCMKHDGCKNYFGVYKRFAKMLVLINEEVGDIIGRAILWEAKDGTLIMDRIYSNESMYNKFFDWAKENNYIRKEYQSYSAEYTWVDPKGNTFGKYYYIEADSLLDDGDFVPYMDTFMYYNGEGVLSNSSSEAQQVLRETGGDYCDY